MGHTYTKNLFMVYPKFPCCWESYVLCGNLIHITALRFYPKEITLKKGQDPCSDRIVEN